MLTVELTTCAFGEDLVVIRGLHVGFLRRGGVLCYICVSCRLVDRHLAVQLGCLCFLSRVLLGFGRFVGSRHVYC